MLLQAALQVAPGAHREWTLLDDQEGMRDGQTRGRLCNIVLGR